jgi:adenylosuccinate synthase
MPRSAIVVVGLGFGDEGKGTIVDYLCRLLGDVQAVVRFSGGAQAAHNVVSPDGRHHTFAQFGAGTLVPGVRTHLSGHTMVDPFAMFSEEHGLSSIGVVDAFERLTVSPDCLVTTPIHKRMNLFREGLRGRNLHGTCGMGIGETRLWWEMRQDGALFARDLKSPVTTAAKIQELNEYYADWCVQHGLIPDAIDLDHVFEAYRNWGNTVAIVEDVDRLDHLADSGTLVFEGAQGILLDEDYGFHPHTTWSKTTSWNARSLLDEVGEIEAKYLGVTRCYSTRHGAGPFPSERAEYAPDASEHNVSAGPQGRFRVGMWDALMTRYAVGCELSLDGLAVTCLDQYSDPRNIDVWDTTEQYLYRGALPDLWPYFDVGDDDVIRGISPPHGTVGVDNSWMEAITNRLLDSEAVVREHGDFDEDYVCDHISETLDLPVFIRSTGATANDKKWVAYAAANELVT